MKGGREAGRKGREDGKGREEGRKEKHSSLEMSQDTWSLRLIGRNLLMVHSAQGELESIVLSCAQKAVRNTCPVARMTTTASWVVGAGKEMLIIYRKVLEIRGCCSQWEISCSGFSHRNLYSSIITGWLWLVLYTPHQSSTETHMYFFL